MTKYLTISEYARLKNVSRQAIHDRIKRGTLETVRVPEYVDRIPVEEAELVDVKGK